MFPIVDTKNTSAVRSVVEHAYATLYPGSSDAWLTRLFNGMEAFFHGNQPDFAPSDLPYHDWEHTLQVTLCFTLLLQGRASAAVEPPVGARHFELGISAALLHDAGFLKTRSDKDGTGAKYTFCHVLRSCAFAAAYLPSLGATDVEIEAVLSAISCTAPANEIGRLRFREPVERVIGAATATADYLGQMASPGYPNELGNLFREFEESDNFLHIPASRRVFQSAEDLLVRTPQFWYKFVRPKLETDFQALYRFLAHPYPQGDNPYLDAVETNIAEIQRRAAQVNRPARTLVL